MSAAKHAFDWIDAPAAPIPPSTVLFGADGFLRRHSLEAIFRVCGVDRDAIQVFDGPETAWRDVHDELATLSLFDAANHRIAIVRDADKFITTNRAALERWVESPPADAILVLEAESFPGTTKLYKQIAAKGLLIQCNPPTTAAWGNPVDEKAIQKWMTKWATSQHGLRLGPDQMTTILERVGTELGLLDCELAKLALFADDKGQVPNERLLEIVGGWRTQTMWEISDHVANGKIGQAMEQMQRLMESGQAALGLYAPLAWSLRRFGLAAQLIEQTERCGGKPNLTFALEQAGFRKFDIKKAETQLRRIGRPRAKLLLRWLVELEMKLKGSHSQERASQFAIEEFIARLA